jgi:hypothetical protein
MTAIAWGDFISTVPFPGGKGKRFPNPALCAVAKCDPPFYPFVPPRSGYCAPLPFPLFLPPFSSGRYPFFTHSIPMAMGSVWDLAGMAIAD